MDVTDVDVGGVKEERYQSVPGSRDRTLKSWNLAQLFDLDTLRGTLLRRQGCNILPLTATPQDLDTCNRGGDFLVLLWRIEHEQPDGIVASS